MVGMVCVLVELVEEPVERDEHGGCRAQEDEQAAREPDNPDYAHHHRPLKAIHVSVTAAASVPELLITR